MLKKISLTVGDPFIAKYPVRTGPDFEVVSGHITEIHLAAAKVTIENPAGPIYVISLEDAFLKNTLLDRQEM